MNTSVETVHSVPCCQTCGSERVVKDAWACFNPGSGLWELEAVCDDEHCHQCEGSSKPSWSQAKHPPHKRIRELNDLFRTQGVGNGSVLITNGIQGEGSDFGAAVVEAVRTFADFKDDNDPWGEHDFGAVEVADQKVFFKLDYYSDQPLSSGPENPANEEKAHRVLTIMLAEEY